MQSDFLSKLYELKSFKIVNSPQPNKQSQTTKDTKSDARKRLDMLDESALNKQNNQTIPKFSESHLFTHLSSSIDHLFSKIERIKEQFDCREEYGDIQNQQSKTTPTSATRKINTPKIQQPRSAKLLSNTKKNCSAFMLDTVQEKQQIKQNTLKLTLKQPLSTKKSALKDKSNKMKELIGVENFDHLALPYKNHTVVNNFNLDFPLSMREFELGKCVGSGKFGDVHMCKHKQTSSVFALKKVFKSTIREYNMIEQFLKQLKIHFFLNNANVTKLYTFFQDDYHVFLLMEYAESGTLYEKFICNKSKQKLEINAPPLSREQSQVSKAIFQVLNGVEYLHRHKIVHRDIKPENIVVCNGAIKLCDFGWSAVFDNEMKKTFCGTLDYVSPEMKDKGQYTISVDLWSIGILTFQLLTGFAPFKKQMEKMKSKNRNSKQDKLKWDNFIFPPEISEIAKQFVRGLLKENPDDRSSIRQCLNHQFIQKYNTKSETDEQISNDLYSLL